MEKKAKILVIVGICVIILGGGGGVGGLYYSAVTQIEIDIDKICITGYSPGGTLLNPTMNLDLQIYANVSNPTIIPVNVEYAEFEIYIDGDDHGDGQTSPFRAAKTPSIMLIDVFLENIGGTTYWDLLDLIILGNSKTITVRITNVKVYGRILEINQDIAVVVTQDDVLI